jgi:pSer/pThr/pTyr-binding forkhead associated (FHA) protein
MDETFKVPPLPVVETAAEDDTASASIVQTEEATHAPVMQPALPPSDFAASVRHKNLQYDVPESSALPPAEYTLEVLRNGSIIDYISLSHRPYTVFGRSPDSDVVLEHPTISRYHAIVQYKSEFEHGQPAGLYLYDCGSTHGTFINKKRLEAKVYVRIKVDYIIKFGQSTRLYLVQGDTSADTDASTNSTGDDVTHEQMKQFHAKRTKKLAIVRAKRENAANEASLSNMEMDWGMGPDDEEIAGAGGGAPAEPAALIIEKIREEEELAKKRTAIDDLRNRMEYQKAKNDKTILQEIMTRVSFDLI